MSLEAWGIVASFATFAVIAATAIVALVQPPYAIEAAVTELSEMLDSEKFTSARRFVAERVPQLIADPTVRSKLGAATLPVEVEAIADVANFFEVMGVFVKRGAIDRALVCDLGDGVVFKAWKQLEPVVMIRRTVSHPGTWASFEYLAVICEESLSKHQGDYYPRGMRRMTIDNRSLATVAAFAQDQGGSVEPLLIP